MVICGDYNICHEAIDIHDPIRNAKNFRILPKNALVRWFHEKWIYRYLSPFKQRTHNYSWWVTEPMPRNNNKGWRIDYCLAAEPLKDKIQRAFNFAKPNIPTIVLFSRN